MSSGDVRSDAVVGSLHLFTLVLVSKTPVLRWEERNEA